VRLAARADIVASLNAQFLRYFDRDAQETDFSRLIVSARIQIKTYLIGGILE
jgi:hypothetical protein